MMILHIKAFVKDPLLTYWNMEMENGGFACKIPFCPFCSRSIAHVLERGDVTVSLAGFGLSLGTYWNVPRNVLARNSDPTSPSGNAQGPGP